MSFFKPASWTLCLAASAALLCANAQAQKPTTPPATAAASAPADADKQLAAKKDGAQLAANAWLLLLDQRNWGGAYENASQLFRNTVPIGSWMDSIPGLRTPFGALEKRAVQDVIYKTTMQGRPDGEYITVIFESDFADKKGVQELVATMREADGAWRVLGYAPR